MDVDAFVAAHRDEWDRLDRLVQRAARPRQLSGRDVDELVMLYQRAATHLSTIRSAGPDPAVVARLSRLVARARAVIAGTNAPSYRAIARFVGETFPAAVYVRRYWIVAMCLLFVVVATALGAWVDNSPHVQSALVPPEQVRELVQRDFADYYRSAPAGSFAAHVWTNNVWVSAAALVGGAALGLPAIGAILANAANVGIIGGYMAANGRTGLFFGLVLPHGMLELTAVFIAAGTGLRLGWRVIDPGPHPRADALAREGRSAITVAVGLVGVLLVSGIIEAFVTPSSLDTWERLFIGGVVEAAFLTYLGVLGRRAVLHGVTADLDESLAGDVVPVAG